MKILNVLLVLIVLAGCTNEKKVVSDQHDYTSYLNTLEQDLTPLIEQEKLWKKKILLEPRGFTFYERLGGTYSQMFEKTGEVEFLHKSDSVLHIAQNISRGRWKVPSLLSLSSLSIKKHDFKSAATYAVMAGEMTNEKFGPLLMQYDAEMELGNYKIAKALLDKSKRPDSFDYLVRLAKYKDYEGDLDSAIYYMEQASKLVLSHEKARKVWVSSSLGDMYGHAGRIEDSYCQYLKALSLDRTHTYALKGIAWVAYSHDGKTEEAKEILRALQQKSALPDYYMLLAEISDFEQNEAEANQYTDLFVMEASKAKYMGMYNKYLIDICIERGDLEKAYRLAKEEVDKRPTPQTYDWFAWTLHKQGKTEEAIHFYRENVEGETHEPDAIYHMGVVYYEAGKSQGERYLEESLESSYELGPIVTRKIESMLKG